MPRGRPPISRTKDEALAARRAQVRKNVQAFRTRKQAKACVQDNHEVRNGDSNLAGEDRGQCNGKTQPNGSSYTDIQTHRVRLSETLCTSDPEKTFAEPIESAAPVGNDRSIFVQVLLPPEINAAQVCRQQLVSNATTAFFPAHKGPHESFIEVGPHWTQTIPDLVNRNAILDCSIQALCLMQIGHINQERWLLQRCTSFYDRALRSLRKVLANPTGVFEAEIFAATMALAAYELLRSTNGNGRAWMYHIEGATTYLNMHPSLDYHAFSQQLSFHFLETACVFDALGARKSNCFSRSTWWRKSVDQFGDDSYGSLLRMITSLPNLLEQCDNSAFLPLSMEANQTWRYLHEVALRLEKAFRDWYEMILVRYPIDELSNRPSRTVQCEENDTETFPKKIAFPSLYAARLYLLYWTCIILLYESIVSLLSNLTSAPSEFAEVPGVDFTALNGSDTILVDSGYHRIQSRKFAIQISNSVPFCLDPDHGMIGKSLILLPIWVARNHFNNDGDLAEATRCDDILDELGQKNLAFGLRVKKGL